MNTMITAASIKEHPSTRIAYERGGDLMALILLQNWALTLLGEGRTPAAMKLYHVAHYLDNREFYEQNREEIVARLDIECGMSEFWQHVKRTGS